PVPRF
ncbi:tonB-dependent Receptor Plug domain protein, partial [Vibrio harveyi]